MSGLLNVETALGSLARGSASAPVMLGSLVLTGVEVPSTLKVGGRQVLAVSQLVGGQRVIRPMGDDPAPLALAGMFIGPDALSRAQLLERMRIAGASLRFSFASVVQTVFIEESSYDYADRGGVIRYTAQLIVQPTAPSAAMTGPSALSALVGPDLAAAATTAANTVATISAVAANTISAAQGVVAEVAPIADMVGAGGLLARVDDTLTTAGGLAGAGVNLAAAPAAAASIATGLQSAGTDLMAVIGQSGANLADLSANAGSGRLVANMASLMAAVQNAGVLAGAVSAGGLTNRATTNLQLATGQTPSLPVVHG